MTKIVFTYLWIIISIVVSSNAFGEEGTQAFGSFFKSQKYQRILVEEAIAPDNIRLENGERIKLIGLKSPLEFRPKREPKERDEYGFFIKEDTGPVTPIEEKAKDFVKELLEGELVRVEFDAQTLNDHSQTLGYVFILKNDTLANEEILRQGYADLHLQPPNFKYAQRLRDAYKEARGEHRGLHNE